MFTKWPFSKKVIETQSSPNELKMLQLKQDAREMISKLKQFNVPVSDGIITVNGHFAQLSVYPPQLRPLKVVMNLEEAKIYLDTYYPKY